MWYLSDVRFGDALVYFFLCLGTYISAVVQPIGVKCFA